MQGATPLHELAVRGIGLAHGRLADDFLRVELARWQVDSLAFRLTLERLREAATGGQGLGPFSSLLKYCGTELNQRREDLAMSIAGVRGLLWRDCAEGASPAGEAVRAWLRSKGNSIEGGPRRFNSTSSPSICSGCRAREQSMQELPVQYSLDEEQQLLQDCARKLLDSRSPVAALRELRDRNDADGFSRRLWAEVAELGWSGMLVPEALGGVALGQGAAGIIASNTLGLAVAKLAGACPRELRPRFCGVHFFNPPRYMHLVEIIPCEESLPSVLHDLERFLVTTLGKGVIRAKDTPNFVANRVGVFSMLATMANAEKFGISFDVVDDLRGPGLGRPKSATFRTADVVGLDTLAHTVDLLGAHRDRLVPLVTVEGGNSAAGLLAVLVRAGEA
jgi:hypothetical protein